MSKYKTLKNKLYATVLLVAGLIPTIIYNDATALLVFGCIGIPMFFAKENWIY